MITGPLSSAELALMDAWWRAANYLSIGQIYLLDNPLLREPLELRHIKPRLLGHWGTTPGQNFLYVHLNRVIKSRDLNMIYVAGPGHGGPGIVANAWLDGTYSEIYPHISRNATGMQRLFKQFSFPGGIPSHAAPETPGSIHEGGELGYALSHAYGAAFDNPDLVVACVVGDGEAETGPMATSWHSNKFLNPTTDGAVLPILHLNGYKIANPTVLARVGPEELNGLFVGYGHKPHLIEGDDPAVMHQLAASTFDRVFDEIREIQSAARQGAIKSRPKWPMIILKTPKGWTGPILFEKVRVSTDQIFLRHRCGFQTRTWGTFIHIINSTSTSGRNRSAAAISVNRRCRCYFGRFATTFDLPTFSRQNRPKEVDGVGRRAARVVGVRIKFKAYRFR